MRIDDFLNETREKSRKELLEVSCGGACFEKSFSFKAGEAQLITIRGGAVEKAAITRLQLNGFKIPGSEVVTDCVVYQMEVFPENPYCPMGHFNTEWTIGEETTYHMNVDLFPAVNVQEDIDGAKEIMDDVAAQFGRDCHGVREGLGIQYNMEHWDHPLAARAGFQLKGLSEGDLNLFVTAYKTFFDTYLDIVKKRQNTRFGEEETRLKHERNGKWLQYITQKDRAIKLAQAIGIPSELLIGLSYPPSAVF